MIEFDLILDLDSPLHIGSERRQATTADRPMLKTQNGLPYIPATSIKGRLRYEVEVLLRSVLPEGAICNPPQPERMCQPIVGEPCPVCALFGSPWYEGPLYFSDLLLSGKYADQIDPLKPPTTTSRAGTRINRRRHVVEEKFLFDTELFEPGVPWSFWGKVRYFDEELDLTPLYVAAHGVTSIGGSRSRGLGWCRLTIDTAPSPEELIEYWSTWLGNHT